MESPLLVKVKKQLYSILLEKDPEIIKDQEVNIMFELSKDKDIQNILERNINNQLPRPRGYEVCN